MKCITTAVAALTPDVLVKAWDFEYCMDVCRVSGEGQINLVNVVIFGCKT